jgi:hypothetical protein
MRRILLAGIAILILTWNANAQNCTQTLRTARTTYDQGRLQEIPTILEACFNKNEWDQSQRVEAYRILVLTYIYLEEPAKADEAMLNILHTDNFFEPNPASDPVEFQMLYKKFRTKPLFKIGLKFGVNTNHIDVIENHYIWAASRGNGKYKSNFGIQVGIIFEKDLKYLKERLAFNPELFYSSSGFIYSNTNPLSIDQGADGQTDPKNPESNTGEVEHQIQQSRMVLNLMAQYKLGKLNTPRSKVFTPYLAFGPSLGYLMSSSFSGNTNVGEEKTGSSLNTKDNYQTLTFGLVVSGGVKLKVGGFYITADIRYQRGLMNIVNEKNRLVWTSENAELLDYGYTDNDFSVSQSMVNIGIIVPYFSPKKLIR